MTEQNTIDVHFAVPMRQLKRELQVPSGTTVREVFAAQGVGVDEMADIVINNQPISSFPEGLNTRLEQETHLWGLVQAEGGK